MDAVRATIESLGGEVRISTQSGGGTTTMLVVPITAAVQRVLLLAVSGETVAVPVSKVERVIEVPAAGIERSGFEAFALVDDCPVAVIDLASRLSLQAAERKEQVTLVLGEVHGELMALEIDHISGHQQIYVKPVPELLAPVRVLAGLTILGDGRPVFVLDLNQLS